MRKLTRVPSDKALSALEVVRALVFTHNDKIAQSIKPLKAEYIVMEADLISEIAVLGNVRPCDMLIDGKCFEDVLAYKHLIFNISERLEVVQDCIAHYGDTVVERSNTVTKYVNDITTSMSAITCHQEALEAHDAKMRHKRLLAINIDLLKYSIGKLKQELGKESHKSLSIIKKELL